ncbi:retinaldehyde-binding protein 1-like [Brevipalpus obovatus]|uniref:retinaldehyde-binding protein 1-like n=1 Tax=Brevipalpus obovatus TaxID=246614 RepID=UPI003D9F0575
MCNNTKEDVPSSNEIIDFRSIVKNDSFLNKFSFPDWYFDYFPRICGDDLEVARKFLTEQLVTIKAIPKVFTYPPEMPRLLDEGVYCLSKARTPEGCGIIIIRAKYWDIRKTSALQIVQAAIVKIFSELMIDPQVQRNGLITIIDTTGLSFSHLWNIPWSDYRAFSILSNHHQPRLIRRVYLLHTNWLALKGYNLLKGLLHKDADESFKIFGDDLTEFHKLVPKSCLPSDFGGTFADEYTVKERLARFEENRESFEAFWNQAKSMP